MIEIVPFEPFHVKQWNFSETLLAIYAASEGFTAMVDEEPLASAGIIVNGKLGSAWGFISEEAKRLPVMLHKSVKRGMQDIIRRHELRRVDVIVNPAKIENVHWATALGFEYEGTMRAFYDDGGPAYLMAWIAGGR